MYDVFSSDYDRFVNWPSRLEAELPFIQAQLDAAGARSALDAACGTGRHAIALAERGYETAGADISQQMVSRARQNAAAAGVDVRFEAAGFGGLAAAFGRRSFDAVLCLGNSLPHVLSEAELAGALADFAADKRIDLTVVGPELPLTMGIVDIFEEKGLRIFGPDKAAAEIGYKHSCNRPHADHCHQQTLRF